MTRPAAIAPTPFRGVLSVLALLGLNCLAIITLASPGATRMYESPWSFAYAGALLAPTLLLIFRAVDSHLPLVLPSRAWQIVALASAAVVLLSALFSPYRDSSLLWSAPLLAAIAVFFVTHDALHTVPDFASRLPLSLGLCFTGITLTSLILWLPTALGHSLDYLAYARNAFPLGHANYTAGLALLALPWFALLAWRTRGLARLGWAVALALAFLMFLTSGSRSAMVGLAALAFTGLLLSPLAPKKKFLIAVGLAVAGLALVVLHPRTRAMLAPADPAAEPNSSNVQRAAMLTAATRMGTDRPVLGWGPGTTPLVYPRYRAGLDGGAENVLQLHSLPAQLWGELGAAGLACAAAFAVLALLHARRHPLAFVTLLGYAVFSIGDWQLDVPLFGFALALLAALLASSPPAQNAPTPALAPTPASLPLRATFGLAALLGLALVMFLGRRDPTPELNVRALALARDPAHAPEAIALLQESLSQNPDQEIAHFNLGWLLVVRDPAAAEQHFLRAARLVPDKGGVYFGLGLARLNQNHPAEATRAFALECLNDPRFLSSPWWNEPGISTQREAIGLELLKLIRLARERLPAGSWAAGELASVTGQGIAEDAFVPTAFFRSSGPERSYRRERTAYPVLMRNLDLPPPTDLYDVRESTVSSATRSTPYSSLPPKGWLPSPLLLELLAAPFPTPDPPPLPTPKSESPGHFLLRNTSAPPTPTASPPPIINRKP